MCEKQKKSRIHKCVTSLKIRRKRIYRVIPIPLPKSIDIKALDECWSVKYRKGRFQEVKLVYNNDSTVTLWGSVHHVRKCREALRQWLMEKARQDMTPWLLQLSREHALPFAKVLVKGQKTIWGSCSRHKNLSINFKLMLIARELVRYVFIHELCHTVYLDHSSRFWDLVARIEPNYKELDKALRSAWHSLPRWVHQ